MHEALGKRFGEYLDPRLVTSMVAQPVRYLSPDALDERTCICTGGAIELSATIQKSSESTVASWVKFNYF